MFDPFRALRVSTNISEAFMKTSKIVAMASLFAIIAVVVGATLNLPKSTNDSTNDVAEMSAPTQVPDPASTASLDPVVVTAKR